MSLQAAPERQCRTGIVLWRLIPVAPNNPPRRCTYLPLSVLDKIKSIPAFVLWTTGVLVLCALSFYLGRHLSPAPTTIYTDIPADPSTRTPKSPIEPTMVYAHNLLLRKGDHFRVYVRWIRGRMLRTSEARNPSFDDSNSFVLEIDKGVINVKLADIADFLNGEASSKAPLKNIKISNEGGQIRLQGTVRKVVSLPVRLDGTLTPLPDGRLQYHLTKLNVLKVPMKGLFGLFRVDLADLVSKSQTPGVQIVDNDIFFDTQRLLPPPHIHGHITSVTASDSDLTVIYGNAGHDERNLAQWHNFLRLSGGNLDFGKLTMHQVDLTMIDASKDTWFDLDLVNYQAQLVYGTTRMTEKAGLEIYMPDLDKLPPRKSPEGVTLQWLKNRNTTPPLAIESTE
ncbi:protein of unknown function (DUF811) [Terriglobus roseus DSM 18391]|uniref:Uncharacterized protein n=1 Tax=Terriglobus roseus (strain DSM 18391 / NRRL B-41598 / KBS 63) TaxID=926566 RepID=I3ZJL7_TERRK|nr:hypothetical protein [Terriglobus roseus]AFL89435.1 protein of unknown function (DUF811) [Terriglobus roseus DSM 18391]